MRLSQEQRAIAGQALGCASCKHYRGLTCDAFPRGIPSAIQGGLQAHLDPVPGDNGITYEPNDETARRVTELLSPEAVG